MKKIIFIGTNNFAEKILIQLIKKNIDISYVITKPDTKKHRGLKISPHQVKKISEKYKIKCITPKNINSEDDLNIIKNMSPNLMIMVDYGIKLEEKIINIPKYGILNIHPSILPKMKGPTPIQNAIYNMEQETGVSIININNEIDSGPILNIMKYKIKKNDTYKKLSKRLSILSIKCIIKTLKDIKLKSLKKTIQKNNTSTYTAKNCPDSYKIKWDDTALNIEKKIKANVIYPFFLFEHNKIKIIRAKQINKYCNYIPGIIEKINENSIDVSTKKKLIRIKKIQIQGKNITNIKNIINSISNLFQIGKKIE